jgi:hypothetical protein
MVGILNVDAPLLSNALHHSLGEDSTYSDDGAKRRARRARMIRTTWTTAVCVAGAASVFATTVLLSNSATSAAIPKDARVLLGWTSIPTSVEKFGLANYSHVFLVDAINTAGTGLDIYLTNLDTAVESAFITRARGVPLTFIQTANSEFTLSALQTRISADVPALQRQGIDVKEWGGGVPLGMDVMHVENLSASQEAESSGMFGTSAFVAHNLTASEVPIADSGIYRVPSH